MPMEDLYKVLVKVEIVKPKDKVEEKMFREE